VLAAGIVLGPGWLVVASAAGPLPPLAGPPLTAPTRLRLIVGNTPPVVVNVDTRTTTTEPWNGPVQARGAKVVSAGNGAYLTTWNGATYRGYLVGADGTVRAAPAGGNVIAARSALAVWTLTSGHGRCTLRLVPSSRAPMTAPCGTLQLDSQAGLVIAGSSYWMLVNPSTGRVTRRTQVSRELSRLAQPLNASFALENTGTDNPYTPGKLTLVDWNTGTRRPLRWPSILPSLQRIAVEPDGPLVAFGFVSVAYPGPQQANDIWLLNTTTGTFTHLPGFPAQESIKFSDMAWTTDDRLVVVDETNTTSPVRAALGIWKPGQTTLPLRDLPPLANTGGYYSFVPVTN
jgi:hypothetical protein